METLIRYTLDTVFIGVRDVKRSIRFYSALFGLPIMQGLFDAPFFPIAMRNGVKCMLAHRFNALMMHTNPTCMFTASDVEAAYRSLKISGANMVFPQVEQRAGMRFFVFREEDGTAFVVSDHPLPYLGTKGLPSTGPLDPRINALNIYANDADMARDTFCKRFNTLIRAEEDRRHANTFWFGNDTRIVVNSRYNGREQKPFVSFQASDVKRLHHVLTENDIRISEKRGTRDRIVFADPDGHVIEVELDA